jgi:hypothetical protein
MTHAIFTLLGAGLLSSALSATENRTPRDRMYAAARVFLGSTAAVVAGSWAMRLIHG